MNLQAKNESTPAFNNDIEHSIAQWELAINSYQSDDPLDLWFRYVQYLESVNTTPALGAKFRKAVEICLSTYDKNPKYKQDLRMVKLWIKYIDFSDSDPIGLYKILYQQGIGTSCAAFFIAWAHYFNSSNLFKQAESIFNLGIQLKAEPLDELETAQKNFRFSLAQRMLYTDESSKKRTISSLAEQRKFITSLSPHQNQQQSAKRLKIDTTEEAYKVHEAQFELQQNPLGDSQYVSTSSDPGQVISESLCELYNNYPQMGQDEEVQTTFDSGFQAPKHFYDCAKNSHEPWQAPLFLEEPFDPNSRCFYPKRSCYPGFGVEFSLEELKAKKWIAQTEQKLRQQQEHERLRQESEAKRLIEEQSRIWNSHNQSPATYGSGYYQQSPYENSPTYSYVHDHRYQSTFNYFYPNNPAFNQQGTSSIQTESFCNTSLHQQQYVSEYQPAATSAHYINYQPLPEASSETGACSVVRQNNLTSTIQTNGYGNSNDYQDVEFLIDHSSEIDPEMLKQTLPVELYENAEVSSGDQSEEEVMAPVVNSYMLDDLEEQIEASTIRFSSNGKSRDKKITIKFRKEKTSSTAVGSLDSIWTESSTAKSSTASSTNDKKRIKKKKQSEIFNTFDGDSTQFMQSSTNSCSSTANGEYTSEFNFSFNGCVTPARKQGSKTSTPVSSNSLVRKISNQNEDSICSFSGDQNSFFQAENDEDLKNKRYESALSTINDHLTRKEIDPFNSELCKALLIKLNFPNRENTMDYLLTNYNLPKLSKNQVVPINGVSYQIEKEVGRGSYGAVFKGTNTRTTSVVALKYQKTHSGCSSLIWELYICAEIKKRLVNKDVMPGFMSISGAVIAPNASVFVSEFSHYGSLLDVNNRIRQATTKVMPENLVMHFTSQILSIAHHLHSVNIIHADIKPDNFLLMTLPSADTYVPSLRLIDFGCAIDMNLFKKGTEFRKIIQTDGFTCIEMQEGRPWTFETDYFCVAGTIHVLLFGEYMQVNKKFGVWEIKQKLPRYLNKNVWGEVFPKLLNIKDNRHLPDLRRMQSLVCSHINKNDLIKNIRTCSNLIRKR